MKLKGIILEIMTIAAMPFLLFAQNISYTDVSLKPGDRWCAIGDSITHLGDWLKYIYLYYATRFPQERFDLINCGSGGDTAQGVLKRLDWDIMIHHPTIVTIMLGVNDIWMENNKRIGPDEYINDMEELISRIKAANCRILLITPPLYDGTVQNDTPLDPLRNGLEKYVLQLRELASMRKIPLLDYFKLMSEITKEKQHENPAFTLFAKDRVHPIKSGHLVITYYFLEFQKCPALVSKLILDNSKNKIVQNENCQIKEIHFNSDSISFTLLEKALPFPVDEFSTDDLKLVPFVDRFNQEILQIKSLKPGLYQLTIDDLTIGQYSEKDFGEGINLALNPKTPQYKQAQSVAEFNAKRRFIISQKLRYITMIEHGELKTNYTLDDAEKPRKLIEERIASINDPNIANIEIKKFDKYLKYKAEQSKLSGEAKDLLEEIFKANKPIWHKYQIKKKTSSSF